MQGGRLHSAYCYCCTVWPAALCGLCSEAEKKKTLAQWETLVLICKKKYTLWYIFEEYKPQFLACL